MGEGLLLELTGTHARQSTTGTTKVRQRKHFAVDRAASGRSEGAGLASSCSTDTGISCG